MGWFAVVLSLFMMWMGLLHASPVAFVTGAIVLIVSLPPLWKFLGSRGVAPLIKERFLIGIPVGLVSIVAGLMAAETSPAGMAIAAEREEREQAEIAARQAEEQEAEIIKAAARATGDHCISNWDGSASKFKDAVKRQLRKPSSFEHVSTVRAPVDEDGKFRVMMTYRAENGFGGTNVEIEAAEITAETCEFRRVRADQLAEL